MGNQVPPARAQQPTDGPAIDVSDVASAAAYYQRFFDLDVLAQDQSAAWLHGHGASVRLVHSDPPPDGRPPTVVTLSVDGPAVLRRRLDDLGAHLVDVPPPGAGPGAFGVRDYFGNVLIFRATGGARRLRGTLGSGADTMRRCLWRWRSDRAHSREVRRLREFIARRSPGSPTFYVHAHGGLLHWLAATVGRLPLHLDVVIIGSDLTTDEQRWIVTELRRPLHAVPNRLDDAGALELLCAAADFDFGWIEIGCLVLEPRVLEDLADLPATSSLSCAWSYPSGWGFPIAAPYLLFFSQDGVCAVSTADPAATAGVHSWRRFNRQVEGRRCYSRIPSRRARRLLAQIAPRAIDGHPAVPAGLPFYEATVLHQLLARTAGRHVHLARTLSAMGNAREEDLQDEFSDELVYIGALSYADPLEEFSGYFHDTSIRRLYLLAESVVLAPLSESLPEWYQRRRARIDDALAAAGLDPKGAAGLVSEHLTAVRGLSEDAARKVVQPPAPDDSAALSTTRRYEP